MPAFCTQHYLNHLVPLVRGSLKMIMWLIDCHFKMIGSAISTLLNFFMEYGKGRVGIVFSVLSKIISFVLNYTVYFLWFFLIFANVYFVSFSDFKNLVTQLCQQLCCS